MSNKKYWDKDETPLKFSEGTGKLKGVGSLNVSKPLACIQRMMDLESVCSKCYMDRFMAVYKTAKLNYMCNAKILTTRELEDNEIPFLYTDILRINSFGELHNVMHLWNIYKIALKNPQVLFVIWTKETEIVWELRDKPENVRLIYSSYKLNKEEECPPMFWGTFTVFNADYAFENKVRVNCNGKCRICMICYDKNKHTSGNKVREIVKNEQGKYHSMLSREMALFGMGDIIFVIILLTIAYLYITLQS